MYDQLRLIFKLKFPKHVLEKRIKSTILAHSAQHKAKIGAKMLSQRCVTMERYSIDYIVSFLWDGDVLEQRKIKQPIREIGASPMS